MNIGEAMQMIAEEAERQGFLARQTRTGMWHFRKDDDNWFVAPRTHAQVFEIFRILITAGLDWPHKD
jgi:hypothetical protein